MKMIEKISGLIETFKSYDEKALETLKYMIIAFIVLDMFAIWWYLEFKRLAMALMLVCAIFLIIVLFCERRLYNMEDKKESAQDIIDDDKKEEKKKKEDNSSDEDYDDGLDLGIPSSEEYNKRLEKAVGM